MMSDTSHWLNGESAEDGKWPIMSLGCNIGRVRHRYFYHQADEVTRAASRQCD